MWAVFPSYADRKAMKRRFLPRVVDGETSIPGLAQTTRHRDVKSPGTRLGTEVLSSFRSVK